MEKSETSNQSQVAVYIIFFLISFFNVCDNEDF